MNSTPTRLTNPDATAYGDLHGLAAIDDQPGVIQQTPPIPTVWLVCDCTLYGYEQYAYADREEAEKHAQAMKQSQPRGYWNAQEYQVDGAGPILPGYELWATYQYPCMNGAMLLSLHRQKSSAQRAVEDRAPEIWKQIGWRPNSRGGHALYVVDRSDHRASAKTGGSLKRLPVRARYQPFTSKPKRQPAD